MCAMVIVDETYSDDLIAYMDERFVFDEEEDGLLVYCDAYEEEDVSMLVGIINGGLGSLMVLYIEYEQEETKSRQAISSDFKNIRNKMKALASEKMN